MKETLFALTGEPIISISAGSIEMFIKTFGYYVHEKIWEIKKK